jgi:hypothetical protein
VLATGSQGTESVTPDGYNAHADNMHKIGEQVEMLSLAGGSALLEPEGQLDDQSTLAPEAQTVVSMPSEQNFCE